MLQAIALFSQYSCYTWLWFFLTCDIVRKYVVLVSANDTDSDQLWMTRKNQSKRPAMF